MNRRMIVKLVGQVLVIMGLLLLIPLVTALIYREKCALSFVITIAISAGLGGLMILVARPGSKEIFAREGFVMVSLSWLMLSLIGALPFVISGEIPNYFDALFETASGFTTTGASVVENVEELSHGILMWRSLTHWIGGMGVIVFVMAVIPAQNDRNMHVMRAEVPGPTVGKLVPRLRESARIQYLIYIGMSLIMMVFLMAGGMSLFDSLCHMFGTAGTGGFGIKSDSVASYSPYLQWVIAIFMIVFSINFNVYYLILRRQFKAALSSREMLCYVALWVAASLVVLSSLMYHQTGTLSDNVRLSFFQTASIMSTSGFSTTDFNTWPMLAKTTLVMLMLIGGCAGSTAGGLKMSRVMMLWSAIKREFRHLLHPRAVGVIRFEGKTVDSATIQNLYVYFVMYIVILLGTIFLLAFDDFDFETNITAAITCFNNVGPGFGQVGPASSFAGYSSFSKVVLTCAMLLGRLEIFPLIIALNPGTWKKAR